MSWMSNVFSKEQYEHLDFAHLDRDIDKYFIHFREKFTLLLCSFYSSEQLECFYLVLQNVINKLLL